MEFISIRGDMSFDTYKIFADINKDFVKGLFEEMLNQVGGNGDLSMPYRKFDAISAIMRHNPEVIFRFLLFL